MSGLLPGGPLRRIGRRRSVVAMAVSAASAVAIAVPMAAASPAMAARTLPAAVKAAATGARPWLEQGQSPGQRASELLAQMTLAQKLQMMDGTGYPIGSDYAGHIQGIPALGIPDLYLSDGAVGVGNGSTGVTWFPDGTNDAATWDPSTVQAVGAADGREQAAKGHNVSLAPNLNILRTPYGGRAFEGYGEDPYLSSQIAAADIQGVQSQGVIATPKHYIGNDQETLRNSIDVQVSQRALAEIYDPAFQASINAGAGAAMCSYNMVNGSYSCQNSQTLAGTLESVMQFKGFVMSDWGATHSTVPSVDAGLDMSMPGGTLFGPDYYGAPLAAAVSDGQVTVAQINSMVYRILWAMFSVGVFDHTYPNPVSVASTDVSTPADNQVAERAAEQGAVLLKNDRGALPFGNRDKSIAVIGDDAGTDARYGGGGSASVNPTNPVTPLAGLTSRATQAGDTVTYAQGNSNYLSLSALPDTGFAPTSGTGPGWTATYYSGSTTTGTPLGSEVVTSLDVTSTPAVVTNAGVSTWSVKYTATLTPAASGVAEFELSAGNNATLSIGGQHVVSYGPGTGSTFTGLASLTAGVAVPFELDATSLAASSGGGPFGPPTVVDLTWAPQENLLWQQAASAARSADVAVVFASNYSAEGSDLQTLQLPGDQDQLIEAVARANANTIVVLNTSGPAYMPWLRDVAGVFEAWYPGQQDGNAIAALLFGDVNPSGHLPETFPANASQGVAHGGTVLTPNLQFPGNGTDIDYSEGIDVGYRYYDTHGQTPLFPFGYGLSYTSFTYSNLRVTPTQGGASAQVTITNTGHVTGAEVAQLYLTDPAAAGEPPFQLKGFQKITLAAGQSQRLTFRITRQDMSYYQTSSSSWEATPGWYRVSIGSNERDLPLSAPYWAG
jgi:beta-glucosidase